MEHTQKFVDRLHCACKEFALTISLGKTKMMAQDSFILPVITVDDTLLEVVQTSTYLGSTVCNTLNVDSEVDSRVAKAAGIMAKLNKRVWNNSKLTANTKLRVYLSCVVRSLLYGSDTWTIYSSQEIGKRASIPSVFILLKTSEMAGSRPSHGSASQSKRPVRRIDRRL